MQILSIVKYKKIIKMNVRACVCQKIVVLLRSIKQTAKAF